jgi:hypothetical protein
MLTNLLANVVSSNPTHDEVYSIQHYVIKYVSELRRLAGFLLVLTNKTDGQYIAEILLKVALSATTLTPNKRLDSTLCMTRSN